MSDTKKFTLEQTMRGLKQLADKYPDKVYQSPGRVRPSLPLLSSPTCFYSHADGPGCIIGHFAQRNGLSRRDTPEIGGAQGLPIWASRSAAIFARYVQMYQDEGQPWGEAFTNGLIDWLRATEDM